MRSIPVDTSTAMLLCATEPKPKVKNLETGEIAKDRETGADMWTVGLVYIANGAADVIQVSVPQPGVPANLASGTPNLAVTGLVAVPWEANHDGRARHGIAFRAAAITVKGAK
jgi:hypothetical protein